MLKTNLQRNPRAKLCHFLISYTNAQNLIVGSEWEHSMNITELKLSFEFQLILTDLFLHLLWYAHTTHSWLKTVELNTFDMVTINHGWSLNLFKL